MPLGASKRLCARSRATAHTPRLTRGTEVPFWARATTPKHGSRAEGSVKGGPTLIRDPEVRAGAPLVLARDGREALGPRSEQNEARDATYEAGIRRDLTIMRDTVDS